MIILAAALAVAGAAYFTVNWWFARGAWKNATNIQRANARIEEARRRDERGRLRDRLTLALARRGYQGELTPAVIAAGYLYVLCALLLRLVGVGGLVGALGALPVATLAAFGILGQLAARRRRLFRRQLLQALTLLAGQIEAGSGPQRALEQIIPSLQDPLGAELAGVMNATVASKDLVGAMRDLYTRYPSRAFAMFVAALEIDKMQGGSLAPALRQAADILDREFSLGEETRAEISQTRGEFFAMLGILALIAVSMIAGGDETAKAAYRSPLGLIGIVGGGAWAGLGVWMMLRLLNKAKGDA